MNEDRWEDHIHIAGPRRYEHDRRTWEAKTSQERADSLAYDEMIFAKIVWAGVFFILGFALGVFLV